MLLSILCSSLTTLMRLSCSPQELLIFYLNNHLLLASLLTQLSTDGSYGKDSSLLHPADMKLFLNFLTDASLPPRLSAAPVVLSCGSLARLHMIGGQGKVKLLCGKECCWSSFMFRPASSIMSLVHFQHQLFVSSQTHIAIFTPYHHYSFYVCIHTSNTASISFCLYLSHRRSLTALRLPFARPT